MVLIFYEVLCLTTCICLLLHWASAQLTGSLTSPGNPYIVTIQITNPSQETLSILAWNNVFDNTSALPLFFTAKDDLGNVVQLASTNVMRAGLSSSDLYTMVPGHIFNQTVDLRQVMQTLPSGPSPPQGARLAKTVFTVALPPTYKGIVGDASAVIAVPPDFSSAPKKLGDQFHSNLQDIGIECMPLRLSASFPLIGDVDPTFASSADGAHIDSQCTAQNLTDLSDALADAGIYAKSLGLAADDPTNTVFPLFFNTSARQTVSSIAKAISNNLIGHGPHVNVYCQDIQNICSDPNVLGYSFTPSFLGDAYIVLCPSGMGLGRALPPCQTIGTATSSHVIFNLMTTLNNIVPAVMTNAVYGPAACELLSISTTIDPTTNPDSLAQLSIEQWGYGLGGSPWNGGSCLPAGGFLSTRKSAISDTRKEISVARSKSSPNSKRPSPPLKTKRDDIADDLAATSACTAAESSLLQFAVENARALAKYASDDLQSTSPESLQRWTEYDILPSHIRLAR